MANRITTIFDMDTKGGVRNLSQLRAELKTADTFAGKAKIGLKGLGDTLKAHAAEGALAAGTALAAFGAKSVMAFQDTALAAGKFADASGLAVEDASRWLEVAGDLGISGDTVTGMFNKLNKEIAAGSPLLDEYGISVVKTADGQVDANATMLKAIDVVSKIKDPTKQAELASKLFGRSWTEASELVTNGAGDVKAALAAVSDQKAIDEEELQKARDLRAAMDNLQDAFQDIQLAVGEGLVPVLTDAAEAATDLKSAFEAIPGVPTAVEKWFKYLSPLGYMRGVANFWRGAGEAILGTAEELDSNLVEQANTALHLDQVMSDLSDTTRVSADRLERTSESSDGLTTAQNLVAEAIAGATAEVAAQNAEVKELRDRHRRAADAVYDLHDAEAALEDAIAEANATMKDQDATQRDVRKSWEDVARAADAAAQKYVESNNATMDSEAGMRLWEESMRNTAATLSGPLREEVINHISRVTGIPTEVVTAFVARTDDASLQQVEAELAWLSRQRFARIDPVTGGIPRYAAGTKYHPGGMALVGEQGPELVSLPRGSSVTPNAQTRSLLDDRVAGTPTIHVTVNAGMGADGRAIGRHVVQALNEYFRAGGPKPNW